jgi:hypothetical protein
MGGYGLGMIQNDISFYFAYRRWGQKSAYATARLGYNSAKVSGKNLGLDDIMEDLAQQFRRVRKAQTPTE